MKPLKGIDKHLRMLDAKIKDIEHTIKVGVSDYVINQYPQVLLKAKKQRADYINNISK